MRYIVIDSEESTEFDEVVSGPVELLVALGFAALILLLVLLAQPKKDRAATKSKSRHHDTNIVVEQSALE